MCPKHHQGHLAYRFHWSFIPSEESLPIAAGRTATRGLARARSIAEGALGAYAADFRMQSDVTSANPPIVETQAGSWAAVGGLYLF
jgi:hypothetical protein